MKARIENRFLKEVELIRRTAQDKKMFWLISPQNYGSLFCISLTESKHMVCISLAVSLHQLYTLEMYQRDARLRKMKKSMLRMKRRIDRLERRIGGDGDV